MTINREKIEMEADKKISGNLLFLCWKKKSLSFLKAQCFHAAE